jgi:hypothetical protein
VLSVLARLEEACDATDVELEADLGRLRYRLGALRLGWLRRVAGRQRWTRVVVAGLRPTEPFMGRRQACRVTASYNCGCEADEMRIRSWPQSVFLSVQVG